MSDSTTHNPGITTIREVYPEFEFLKEQGFTFWLTTDYRIVKSIMVTTTADRFRVVIAMSDQENRAVHEVIDVVGIDLITMSCRTLWIDVTGED